MKRGSSGSGLRQCRSIVLRHLRRAFGMSSFFICARAYALQPAMNEVPQSFPEPQPPKAPSRGGSRTEGGGLHGLFLREALTSNRLSDPDPAFSVTAGFASLVHANSGTALGSVLRSDRSIVLGHIGGGGTGFDGRLFVDTAAGVRWSVRPEHGPIARLAARGWLEGNDRFYSSLIELPSMELGYQWLERAFMLEAAGRAGVSLVGRFNLEGAERRRLGDTWTWGGHAMLHVGPVLGDIDWLRVETPEAPVSILRGELCAAAHWLLFCAELERGTARVQPVDRPPGADVAGTAWVYGFSIGIGQHGKPSLAIGY